MATSRIIILLILIISPSQIFSQNDSAIERINNTVRESFKSKKQWSEKIREGIYYKNGFERYKGSIRETEDGTFHYDSIILKVQTNKIEYNIIFEKGIFHPGIFIGDQSGEIMQAGSRPDSMTALGTCFNDYNIIGVSVFDEVKTERYTYTIKRFRLWQWLCGFANPREYIFDLENEHANKETTLEEFIIGSKLTFIRFITIII
jgi:hypothetical protein